MTVRHGGEAIPVPRGKQRVVLAALLLSANRAVSLDEIADVLWGSDPPPSAHVTIRNYVRRLRRGLEGTGHSRLTSVPGGYMISVAAGELDVARFEALTKAAASAARDGNWQRAAPEARAALALWRGQPLTGVESDALAVREVPRLAEMRLQVLQTRIDADLQLGRHAEVVAELGELAAAHPLREQLHTLLMLALYRSGRQADALAAYQRVRRALIEEIGIEPGTQLRELHRRILTGDPALAARGPALAPAGSAAPTGHEAAIPRELPSRVPQFVGRSSELATLNGLITPDRADAPEKLAILAISGTAGVGKTALVLHWAHQVAARFPGGQLYVDLRGYDPGQPVPPGDALARFLRALGVPGTDIPVDPDERAARYRSLIAERRMLVVLDNAGSAEQVRSLLPGTATCVTIVTSRDSLAGLVARDGARRLVLDVLPAADSTGLLRELIGGRADAEPDAATALAGQCSGLPLALRLAAELAVARPAESLASLGAELGDLRHRLDLLGANGDARSAVRAVFSWSYQRLPPDAALAFRLAGLQPGPDFDSFEVAALADTSPEHAGSVLRLLARAHLIQPSAIHRYAMHDLLRAYAREQAEAEDGAAGQEKALTRLLDRYLYTTSAAMDALFPAESHRRPQLPAPAGQVPPVADPGAARAWLEAGVPNLTAAAAHAASHGWPAHATHLAGTLFRFLEATGRYPEIEKICGCSLSAARHSGDRAGEAEALNNLTVIDLRQGRYGQAADRLRQALTLYEETENHLGQARALGNLGIVRFQQGSYRDAELYQQRALEQYRRIGDGAGEPRTLNNLGITQLRQGHYQDAADGFQYALTLHPDPDTEGYCLANLGLSLLRLRRYREGTDNLRQSLAQSRQTGNLACEAYCLVNLGLAEMLQDRFRQAAAHLGRAVAISRKEGDQSAEADALNGLGEISLTIARPGRARIQHTRALGLASDIGDRYEQARAHNGLGRAWHALGEPEAARQHWQAALDSYDDMGVPEADEVRARLAVTGQDSALRDLGTWDPAPAGPARLRLAAPGPAAAERPAVTRPGPRH
jgi:DNA-binding SARP family transcriptional activator/Tfp pilus assembly protein PilF